MVLVRSILGKVQIFIIPLGEREPNRSFLNLNGIKDGLRLVEERAYASERIMRKDTKTAKLTKIEVERNKQISKKRYIAAPYGIKVQIFQGTNGTYNMQSRVNDIVTTTIPRGKKQYFGLSHLHNGFLLVEDAYSSERAQRARFTTIIKNTCFALLNQL